MEKPGIRRTIYSFATVVGGAVLFQAARELTRPSKNKVRSPYYAALELPTTVPGRERGLGLYEVESNPEDLDKFLQEVRASLESEDPQQPPAIETTGQQG